MTINGDNDLVSSSGENSITLNGNSELIEFGRSAFFDDVISGFNSTDVIQFSKLDFPDWQFLQGAISQHGADTLIQSPFGLLLHNVQATSLTESQFKFV